MTEKLSKKQLATLHIMAHKAWRQLVTTGADSGDWRDEQDWRRGEQELILGVGKVSLSYATQSDYPKLYNHFAEIAGVKIIANNTRTPIDKAIWVLTDAMRKHELTPAYMADIARCKFPHLLTGYTSSDIMPAIRTKLSREQIMQLVYTVTNRGRAKTRNLANTTGATPTYEPHSHPTTLPPGNLSDHFGSTLI